MSFLSHGSKMAIIIPGLKSIDYSLEERWFLIRQLVNKGHEIHPVGHMPTCDHSLLQPVKQNYSRVRPLGSTQKAIDEGRPYSNQMQLCNQQSLSYQGPPHCKRIPSSSSSIPCVPPQIHAPLKNTDFLDVQGYFSIKV